MTLWIALIAIIISATVAGVWIYGRHLAARIRDGVLAEIVRDAGGNAIVRSFPPSVAVSGTLDGIPYELTGRGHTRSAPPVIAVSLAGNFNPDFAIRQRTVLDDAADGFAAADWSQNKDAAFADRFVVSGGGNDLPARLFGDEETRRLIAALFDAPVLAIRTSPNRLTIERRFNYDDNFGLTELKRALDLLTLLARRFHALPPPENRPRVSTNALRLWLGGPLVLLMAAGWVMLIVGMERHPPLHASIVDFFALSSPWASAGWGLYGLFVLMATRRRTDRRFFVLLMIVLGLPAFLLFATGSAHLLNGAMDRSAPVEISATASGLFSSGRGKKIRFIVDGRPSNVFDARGVSANPEGDTVHVHLHSGRLGIPWVSRWRIASP